MTEKKSIIPSSHLPKGLKISEKSQIALMSMVSALKLREHAKSKGYKKLSEFMKDVPRVSKK